MFWSPARGSIQDSALRSFHFIQHRLFLPKELPAALFAYLFPQNRQQFSCAKNSESGLRQEKEKNLPVTANHAVEQQD
ncbi:MAG: hypothetical protein LUE13_09890 [Akkermansiaceae bacterium]|nr:hypothetical protein [Akkermansiaceae bacterium]